MDVADLEPNVLLGQRPWRILDNVFKALWGKSEPIVINEDFTYL